MLLYKETDQEKTHTTREGESKDIWLFKKKRTFFGVGSAQQSPGGAVCIMDSNISGLVPLAAYREKEGTIIIILKSVRERRGGGSSKEKEEGRGRLRWRVPAVIGWYYLYVLLLLLLLLLCMYVCMYKEKRKIQKVFFRTDSILYYMAMDCLEAIVNRMIFHRTTPPPFSIDCPASCNIQPQLLLLFAIRESAILIYFFIFGINLFYMDIIS